MSHISLTYHIIWRTYRSERTIAEAHQRDLYAYLFGICKDLHAWVYRINSMEEHVHICLEIPPMIAVSEFMKTLKQSSSIWMKDHHEWFPRFQGWGSGYAAFTYSVADRRTVVEYIKNQKEHHRHTSFKEEYEQLMRDFGLDPSTDLFLKDD